MFRNYLAAALRNLLRNRLYAIINVTGLSVGFAAALLIALFVRDELSFDRWIPGYERIYRVSAHSAIGDTKIPHDVAPIGAAEPLRQEFPEIEAIAEITAGESFSIRKGDIESVERFQWASANFFDVMALPAIAGELRKALDQPDGIVLTRSLARKYFGTDSPIGETLEFDRRFSMRVTAVLEDLPSNTHLDLGIIAPLGAVNDVHRVFATRDHSRPVYTYFRLAAGAAVDRVREALPAFNERHPEFATSREPYWVDAVVPLADIHLRPANSSTLKPPGSVTTIASAMATAILIATVAIINFVNLTTAWAVRRAVEVGVRKVSGAMQRQLIAQFIGEAMIHAALGMTAALTLTTLLLPSYNGFLNRTMVLDVWNDPILLLGVLGSLGLVGIAAGAYPAFVLSHFSPAAVLKGVVSARRTRSKGRQVLVATQFAVLIVLALVAAAITRQVRYASTESLRLQSDQMLVINGGQMGACGTAFVAAAEALPGVLGATCIVGPILGSPVPRMEVSAPHGMKAKAHFLPVDLDTFSLYGLAPVAGRSFSRDYGADIAPEDGRYNVGGTAVVNEALSRALGYAAPQDAIGNVIRFTPTIARNSTEKRPEAVTEIVGVMPDFGANRDVREHVPPRVFFVEPEMGIAHGSLHIKLRGDQIPETLAAIDDLWKSIGPARPIERVFLDQTIEALYREHTRLGQTVATFAGVAVFISCLGLFGLAAFIAEQRTKEIGVRKALGASRVDIVRSMLWDFSKPVLWASLVAWPVGYFIARRWLENFADRIDLGLWTYPLASAGALAIGLLTVIGHALLIARAQPVKALRYE